MNDDLRDYIEAVFAAQGLLASRLPGYEPRPGQIDMAVHVGEALSHGGALLVEAGTGIGKSLAYLVPAAWWSLTHEEPVIVSTYTRALQEQLILKDIPVVEQVTRDVRRQHPLRAVTLKGRANYLCRQRWQTESARRSPDPELANLVQRLRPWVASTKTGDKSELALNEADDRLFSRLAATVENCSNSVCRAREGKKCFFTKARNAAQRADLVVVNHALLFSDHGAGGSIFPAATRLIVDEAHHLDAAATQQFSYRLSLDHMIRHIETLVEVRGTSAGGFLPTAVGLLSSAGVFAGSAELTSEALGRVHAAIQDGDRFAGNAGTLFDALAHLMTEHNEAGESSARVTPSTRRLPQWSDIEIIADDVAHDLKTLLAHGEWIAARLSRAIEEKVLAEPGEAALAGVSAWIDDHLLLDHHVNTALLDPDPNGVYWIEKVSNGASVAFCSAPLDVGAWISESVFAEKETVVLTSATLTVNGSFAILRHQTGITEATELITPSPFDYASSALVYLVNDIVEPGHRDYQNEVDRAIEAVSVAMQGRTLALFTSHRHLRDAAAALREPLNARGIELLAQGIDAPPRELAARLRSGESLVVLGAASMWEGIDIPGPGLSGLVVVRLPFDVPSDPLFQARSERYHSPFNEYSVPRAVLRFRQGFGRLIRSVNDRGICVILDRRLISKSYGRSFLSALPDCQIERGSLSELGPIARKWMSD